MHTYREEDNDERIKENNTKKISILASSHASDGNLREQKMQPRDKFNLNLFKSYKKK